MTADQRRRAVAASGAQKDLKIHRFDQIPSSALAELAARYGIGDIKYGQKDGLDNWRHGMPWSWSYRALIGHANDFWAGENVDEMSYLGTDDESAFDEDGDPRPGVLHLAAVMWHAAALIEWLTTHPENDDRPSTVQRRLAAGLAGSEDDGEVDDEDEDDEDDFTGPYDGRIWIAPGDIQELPNGWQDMGYTTEGRTKFTNVPLETIELAVGAEPGSLFRVPAEEAEPQGSGVFWRMIDNARKAQGFWQSFTTESDPAVLPERYQVLVNWDTYPGGPFRRQFFPEGKIERMVDKGRDGEVTITASAAPSAVQDWFFGGALWPAPPAEPSNPRAELEIFDKVTWKFDSESDKAVYTVIGVEYDFVGKKFRYDITADRSGVVRRAIPITDLTLQ